MRGGCSVAEVRAQKNGRNQLECCPLLTKTRVEPTQEGERISKDQGGNPQAGTQGGCL